VGKASPSCLSDLNDQFNSVHGYCTFEALLLERIYNAPVEPGHAVGTAKLPDAYVTPDDEVTDELPSPEVQLALWNVVRLACTEPSGTWGGGSTVSGVTITALGRALIQVCTENPRASEAEEPMRSDWD
jgi:hypothetical protein